MDFRAQSLPWYKKQVAGEGCLVSLGTNQMCWSCVSLRNGVEPDKERTAEEQTIAGGGAFTWIKEGLGLIPMCVRLNPQPELLLNARNLLDRAGLYPNPLKVSLLP